jgi:hypothetical protein
VNAPVAPKTTEPRSPGCLTHFAVFVLVCVVYYQSQYPLVYTPPLAERAARHFMVALAPQPVGSAAKVQPATLHDVQQGRVDTSKFTFLLPPDPIEVDADWDHHSVTVVERHPDWQLIEYYYGNTAETIGRYRAWRDRLEPVEYRIVADAGIGFAAPVLLVFSLLLSTAINFVWRRVARARAARPTNQVR